MEDVKKYWLKDVLEHIPHGEEGSLQCTEEEATTLSRLLLKKGYAVCLTGGDFGDQIAVRWFYAGGEDLSWADYERVVFTSVDYLEDYPSALDQEMKEDCEM